MAVLRARNSRSLTEFSAVPAADAPLLSVVIPARNEARNIERCVRSVLASNYPRLEVVAVDDHSTDGTAAILQELASGDPRLRVVTPAALPAGWFGKQWACTAGYAHCHGDVVAFFDADTWQSVDLLTRATHAMEARGADMLTVAGTQELGSFWERLVQPQVFAVMLQRFGGTETVNRSRHASEKIANGQCIFFRRAAYDDLGGHAAVRDKVAEDLALAQHFFLRGKCVVLVLGLEQLYTRMYTSLAELVAGWGKNLYAGGRDAMPFGRVGRAIYPLLLLAPGLAGVLPPLLLVLAWLQVLGPAVLVWSAIVTVVNLVWWSLVYVWLGLSPAYALLHPLGAGALFYIALRSLLRGRAVEWKGRAYRVE